jgi:hypothetical protein
LCSDPEVHPIIREASPFRAVIAAYGFTKASFDRDAQDYFTDVDDLRSYYGPFAEEFLARTRERYDTTNLVLKEPHLTQHFPDVAELIDDARFILIVRDPRDVVASMLEVGERIKSKGRPSPFGTDDAEKLGNHFKSFYAASVNCTAPGFEDRCLYVKYERLVGEPTAEIERLRKFTGLSLTELDPGASWRESDGGEDAMLNYYDGWATTLFGKEFSPKSVGRFRRVLTDRQIKQVERVCRDAFDAFDYSLTA